MAEQGVAPSGAGLAETDEMPQDPAPIATSSVKKVTADGTYATQSALTISQLFPPFPPPSSFLRSSTCHLNVVLKSDPTMLVLSSS